LAVSLRLPDVEAMPAEEVLLWAYGELGDTMCLTCSWQRQSSVLVHMVSELGLKLPCLVLDRGVRQRTSTGTAHKDHDHDGGGNQCPATSAPPSLRHRATPCTTVAPLDTARWSWFVRVQRRSSHRAWSTT